MLISSYPLHLLFGLWSRAGSVLLRMPAFWTHSWGLCPITDHGSPDGKVKEAAPSRRVTQRTTVEVEGQEAGMFSVEWWEVLYIILSFEHICSKCFGNHKQMFCKVRGDDAMEQGRGKQMMNFLAGGQKQSNIADVICIHVHTNYTYTTKSEIPINPHGNKGSLHDHRGAVLVIHAGG